MKPILFGDFFDPQKELFAEKRNKMLYYTLSLVIVALCGFVSIIGMLVFRYPKKPESTRIQCIMLAMLFPLILVHLSIFYFAPHPYPWISMGIYGFILPFWVLYTNKKIKECEAVERDH